MPTKTSVPPRTGAGERSAAAIQSPSRQRHDPPVPVHPEPRVPRHRWLLLALATLQQAGLTAVRFGIPVLAPFIRADLGLSLSATGMILGAFDLGALLTFYATGRLTDRFGDRRVMAAGAIVTGAVTAAAALGRGGFGLLLGLLVLAGTGFPSSQVAGSHAVVGWFPVHERGLAMGIRQAGLPAGGFAAALVLPGLAAAWGWRVALMAAALACMASGVLVGLVLPRDEPGPRQPVPAGVARAGTAPAPGGTAGGPARPATGHAPAAARQPGAWEVAGWFFRQAPLVLVTLVACLLASVQFSLTGYLPLFMEDVFRWPPEAAGRLLLVVHLGGVLGRLAWGWASDRVFGGERARPMAGAALTGTAVAALLVLVALAGGPGWGGLGGTVAMVLLAGAGGFGCLGWNGLYTTVVAEQAGPRSAPALGLSMTVLYVFTMLAPPLFGRVVDAAGHYAVAWGMAVVLQVLGFATVRRLHRTLTRPGPAAAAAPPAGRA
ncbi:major facilitator superfamily MFS_1 [Thermaerobacter marianensis DSM 12885]|uniref:Major facilitator superfamily MFS_1 n=1 Tax=Thermaerobacter marianensis (strain ATCC 700841 / DSM 12885 / JCM 10246 / 7p75a) TaxID=644966 RepID=E6SK59_THEM7|nr:MFS transporter [Thermaerobacter marianensis]ADU51200.1 major facilitator superfamily MFS_1 [Thermaerobacter marianensis DSM 12885]